MARNAKNTRMCAGCMKRADKTELVCVRKIREGEFSVGESGKSGGRSVYVCPQEKCLERAIKRKAFSRNFKCEVPADDIEKIRETAKYANQE